MNERTNEPEHLLASLLGDEQPGAQRDDPPAEGEDDVDAIIDELEALAGEGKRRLLGRKLMIDEDRLLNIVDRLRSAVPAEVRQAHRILDEHDRIIEAAHAQAQQALNERGLLDKLDSERRRVLDEADREAERIRNEADKYVHTVLVDLEDRLAKIQASVRNGIDALQSDVPPPA